MRGGHNKGTKKHAPDCNCGNCPTVGRPPKPKILLSADKGIASRVLGRIDEEAYWLKLLQSELADEEFRALPIAERRLVEETLEYLTNRRDGKPAQGVFVGDTRESSRELDFGDLPSPFAAGELGEVRKPN